MNNPPAPSQSLFTDGWSVDHIYAATAGSKVLIERTDAIEREASSSIHQACWPQPAPFVV